MKRIEQVISWRFDGTIYDSKDAAATAAGYHKCPKCAGTGTNTITYNAYPSGFPDSGWAEDMKNKNVTCDLCNGFGYTERKFEPVVVGYRVT